jgi:hypothetical protein
MNRTSNGTPGTDANSIIKAEAIAAHILYNLPLINSLSPAFVTKTSS